MRLLTLLLCIVASTAFTTPPCAVPSSSAYTVRASSSAITDLNVLQSPRFIKPTATALEVRLNGEDEEVKVVEIEVDPFTLTAVGFGLIAFNFLVLANVSAQLLMFLLAHIYISNFRNRDKILTSTCFMLSLPLTDG